MKYLDKFLKEREQEFRKNVEVKFQKPYQRDHIFSEDLTIRENRELARERNKEIHENNYWLRVQRKEEIQKILLDITLEIESEEDFLDLRTASSLVAYCLNQLGRNERKLYNWTNVKNLAKEIEGQIEHIREVFGYTSEEG